ncbi:histidine phosphatase family protein [Acetobacter sp. DsW_063]|uniref:histidine phosphatase family protein n=1 Tax=Acetobacter sp. DsW_063 TaxID=1514894 RepID=UPI000A3A0348
MPPIILARHPHVNIRPGICYGRTDVELLPGWESFADGLSTVMHATSCLNVYSSPATRCSTVARRITSNHKHPPHIDVRLSEYDFGDWEARSWDDVEHAALELWNRDSVTFSPPNGETGVSLLQRVNDFWNDVSSATDPICVISHGGPLRVLTALAVGREPKLFDPSPPQGSIRIFSLGPSIPTYCLSVA